MTGWPAVLLVFMTLGSPASAQDLPAEADAPPEPPPGAYADSELPPAWGPLSLSFALSSMRGPDTGARSLPSPQLTVRLGARLNESMAVEVEGLLTAAAGPSSVYGFNGWGVRTQEESLNPGVMRDYHPTAGGAGVLLASRLGSGKVRIAGPKLLAMDVIARVGVRGVWTRHVFDRASTQTVSPARLRPAMVFDLEVRLPVATDVALGLAGAAQAMSTPQGDVGTRTSVAVGLGGTLTWSPGRDAP